tara:strand:+ start:810 stop:1406 length:597 start_codon:yes stop_codon:yes gene_type:complete
MIKFNNLNNSEPYNKLYDLYLKSLDKDQQTIEALLVASFCSEKNTSDARYVNLKIVDDDEFIFFSNYNSPKSNQFKSNNRITCVLYWSSIYTQIRMKGTIKKTSRSFNIEYFKKRSPNKNALAISSSQSDKIENYAKVIKNYENSLTRDDLSKCPEYWGGYSFKPNYFEFWEGHEKRLNKRVVYNYKAGNWQKYFIQP